VINWRILAVALAMGLASNQVGQAQTAQNPLAAPKAPPYKYPVAPQAGEWLICVQTFKEVPGFRDEEQLFNQRQARLMAESMAEFMQRECRLPAYLYERGHKERMAEEARIQSVRDQYWDSFDKLQLQGLDPVRRPLRYRTTKIPYEYAVLVGKRDRNLKDMDAARDFLNDVHKLKTPPKEFCSQAVLADDDRTSKKAVAYLSPFATAMVVHNPTIEFRKEQDDPEKADKFLKQLNAEEPLSVLGCSKPWTLVVKVYQGPAMLKPPKGPSVLNRLGLGKKEPAYLDGCALNAHQTAELLRKMKPSFDAYVMHQRQYSIVTVGQYESATDPNLLAAQRSLAGLQIKGASKDQFNGVVLETLSAQPLPMKIPR
jgi:hypothetical protein